MRYAISPPVELSISQGRLAKYNGDVIRIAQGLLFKQLVGAKL
jgi:hypothetical protein